MLNTQRVLAGLGILLILVVILTVLLRPKVRTVVHPPDCRTYANQSGTGDTCSSSSPCSVEMGISKLRAGDVLCLKTGTYTGGANMLTIPATIKGTSESRIWIRAQEEGKVLIDGEDTRRPLQLSGGSAWIGIWGFNLTRGDNMNAGIFGDDGLVQRVISWDVGTNTDHNIALGGNRNVLEDSAAFGTAEKQITAGANASHCTNNVIRRTFAIWQDAGTSTSPTNTYELGYDQDCVIMENVIGTWNRTGNRSQPEGVLEVFRTHHSKILGSIVYVRAGYTYDATSHVFFGISDAGSAAGQGNYDPASDTLIEHVVSVTESTHAEFAEIRGFSFAYDSPGPHGVRNYVRNILSISGQPINCAASDWTCERMQNGTSVASAIGSGKSVWTDSYAGPGICKQYVNGVLTSTPLWPWPMNQRIVEAMTQAGESPTDVTQTVEQLLGTIPSQCRSDSVQPEPIPPGVASLLCTGTLASIPGTVQLRCVPER